MSDGRRRTWRYVATRELLDGEYIWSVRELFRDSRGRLSWSQNPVNPCGGDREALQRDLRRMHTDCRHEDYLDLTVSPPRLCGRSTPPEAFPD